MKVRAVPIFSIVRLEAEDSALRGKRATWKPREYSEWEVVMGEN